MKTQIRLTYRAQHADTVAQIIKADGQAFFTAFADNSLPVIGFVCAYRRPNNVDFFIELQQPNNTTTTSLYARLISTVETVLKNLNVLHPECLDVIEL